jgi:hypothetical protein
MSRKQLFPQFEPGLTEIIENGAVEKSFKAGDVIMRTGQYIKSTVLALAICQAGFLYDLHHSFAYCLISFPQIK